jgi:pyruvate/2-oxoglutarate dehydrogenase complex dihydrolipoamide acyltransferase (E2) component
MPNVRFTGPARESSWRRVAGGMWGPQSDPTIYGLMDLDARALLARIDALRSEGVRVTVTHVVAKAAAEVLHRLPDLNVVLRRHRSWQRLGVDVFLQVSVEDEGRPGLATTELSGVKIDDADRLDLVEFASRVDTEIARTRKVKDQALDLTRKRLARVPRFALRPLMKVARYLTTDLNLDLSAFGVSRDPFGSIAITSVGMLGIETAFAPLLMGGPPMVITVGAIRQRPVVDEQGQIVARPILRLGGTFDHRVLDGYQIGVMAKQLRALLERDVADL